MKTLLVTTLSLTGVGLLIIAAAQSPGKPEPQKPASPAAAPSAVPTATPTAEPPQAAQPVAEAAPAPAAAVSATPSPISTPEQAAPATPPAKESSETKPKPAPLTPLGPDELRLNFRNAPLESVLNYLSDAAGYIIVPETGGDIKGKVTMWSNQPVTKDEALDLLGSALDQNDYAFKLVGRTMTIYRKSDAKTKDIPVKSSNNPLEIPKNDQIVTQIIPVKFINAVQLSRDLQTLKPDSASWSANEGGNSLIVTDTQANIRHLVEIIKALDTAISSVSSVKVFKLQYADSKAVASVIKDLFAPQDTGRSTGGNASAAARFFQQMRGGRGGGGAPGGFGGGAPGGFGGGAAGGDTSSAGGGRAPTPKVVAVSEDRSNSVIVSAPEDQMPIITEMITQLDTTIDEMTELKVFRLRFADAQETADLLTSLFSDSSSSSGNQNFRGGQIQFGGRFGGGFGATARGVSASSDSARLQKQTKVVAVADLRTGSVIVSAARDLMRQIEGMVTELDSDPAKKQQVFVYDVQNTDPAQVQTILQTLFPQANGINNNNRMNQNQAGTGNQLNNRATRNQNNMGNTGFGTGSRSGSGGVTFGQ